jgi:hypothetical protein
LMFDFCLILFYKIQKGDNNFLLKRSNRQEEMSNCSEVFGLVRFDRVEVTLGNNRGHG